MAIASQGESLNLYKMDGAIMRAGDTKDWQMLEALRLMCVARIIEIDSRLTNRECEI